MANILAAGLPQWNLAVMHELIVRAMFVFGAVSGLLLFSGLTAPYGRW